MKTGFLKSTLKFMVMALVASTIFVSCNKDDDPDPDPIIVLDGLYLKVDGATDADLISNVKMKATRNEVLQEERSSLVEIYMALEANSAGFNIVHVAGASKKVYGPAADFALVAAEALDVEEPKEGLWKGGYEESTAMFTVPEDGLYHIMLDTELGKMAIAKVVWGLIGGATPGGWSDNTAMAATFNKDKMDFVVENVTMLENEYKFRYSNGWKIILDTELDLGDGKKGVKVNTNLGGSLTALVPGGDNIVNAEYAIYKFTMTWEKGVGISVVQLKTGEAEPLPEYPENLYMIGASIGGWDWAANGIQMIPVHSNPHLFWRIVWIESGVADAGVKFAPGMEWVGDFGVTGDATDGVWAKGGSNLPDIAASGYYMVVVNLLTETIEVNAPKVYGIGDAFGTWDAAQAAAMFTVDNTAKLITSPAFVAAAELRIHVAAATLTNDDGNAVDWWQAEFVVLAGQIEYRGTGNDQARYTTTLGQTVALDFVNGTGTFQ
ncbi:MAG: SusF/SusE family outer membrane protein [Bacteroidales bacterium]|nr:SusF/SusE family outer membrane protein [Bacteroidales bacterium]MCF8390645.1 SusF/SusE family outer membrane protein [Bacteroidales bacterium]